jgi:hypothetical protein
VQSDSTLGGCGARDEIAPPASDYTRAGVSHCSDLDLIFQGTNKPLSF